jgi:hypothetical protein
MQEMLSIIRKLEGRLLRVDQLPLVKLAEAVTSRPVWRFSSPHRREIAMRTSEQDRIRRHRICINRLEARWNA